MKSKVEKYLDLAEKYECDLSKRQMRRKKELRKELIGLRKLFLTKLGNEGRLESDEQESLDTISAALRNEAAISDIIEYGKFRDKIECSKTPLTNEALGKDEDYFLALEDFMISLYREIKAKRNAGESLDLWEAELERRFNDDYNNKAFPTPKDDGAGLVPEEQVESTTTKSQEPPTEEADKEKAVNAEPEPIMPMPKGDSKVNLEELYICKEEKEKSCLIPWAIAGVCLLLAILFGLNWYLSSTKNAKQAADLSAKLTAAEKAKNDAEARANSAEDGKAAAENKLKECQDKAAKAAAEARMKMATIGKKEGIEHAFIRQLIANPSLVDGVKMMVDGEVFDLTFSKSKKPLKEWAGWAADKIARNQGYVAGDKQVWVKTAGVAYLLENNGKGDVVTKEHEMGDDGNFKATPTDSKESSSLKVQVFEGDQKGGIQGYEKVHTQTRSAQSLATIADLIVNFGAVQAK